MIAHPTARQPVLQLMLTVTLGALVCYSFTTARAVEKEVPAKERSRDGARAPAETEKSKPGAGDEGAASGTKKTGDGEGGTKKPGMGDGEGSKKKPGMRDGEGGKKTGARDGEGGTKKSGSGDGEGGKKTGARDGEGSTKKSGMRDGEGGSKKTGARDGDKKPGTGTSITLRVIKKGEAVMVGDEEVSMNRLRGHLSTFLPEHAGAKIIVTGEDDVPMSAMHNTVDAVRDNGNKNVGIQAE